MLGIITVSAWKWKTTQRARRTESRSPIGRRGAGLYRFYGSYIQGGFWADARLEYRAAWHVTVESTNYMGAPDRLAGVIGTLAERM
jgi:hypothetical protein